MKTTIYLTVYIYIFIEAKAESVIDLIFLRDFSGHDNLLRNKYYIPSYLIL